MYEIDKQIKYDFCFYFKEEDEEKSIIIMAENDEEAVKKFYDKIGIAEFGCLRADGYSFIDDDYPELKEKMKNGC